MNVEKFKSQILFFVALMLLTGAAAQQAKAQDTYTLAIESPMGFDQNIAGTWDSGSLTVKINDTFTKSFGFGQFTTKESLASGLAALIARECHGIASAKADGNIITFHLRYPAQAPLVISPQTPQWDSAHFSFSSFQFGALTAVSQSVASLALSSDHSGESVAAGTTVNFSVDLSTGNPSGTVEIYDNGQKFDTKTLVGSSASTSRTVSSGTHVFYARYIGDSSFAASNSNSVYHTGTTAGPSANAGLYSYDITNGYQADGNIQEYKDSVTGHWIAGYDALNRLTSHVAIADSTVPSPAYAVGRNNCWAYDSFGNMVAYGSSTVSPCPSDGTIPNWMTTINYDTDNRISGASYDNAGNMRIVTGDNSIQSGVFYDGDGRVCATRQGGGGIYTTTVYVYDGSGNRVAEGITDGSTSTPCDLTSPNFHQTKAFIIGPDGSQMTELAVDSSGGVATWQHTSIMAGGARATYNNENGAETPAAGKLHFAVSDWLGTRRLQTGYNGAVEGNWASLPYGNDEHCAFGCTTGAATEHHFTGKERDDESGLDYFGARYMSSAIGRWTAPDTPFADQNPSNPQSWNLYSYTRSNPLNAVDTDGQAIRLLDAKNQQEADAQVAEFKQSLVNSPYANRLYTNVIDGQYYLAIAGARDEFKSGGYLEQNLAYVVDSEIITDFTHSNELKTWGTSMWDDHKYPTTLDVDGRNAGGAVTVLADGMQSGVATIAVHYPGVKDQRDPDRPTLGETIAHEIGHRKANMQGRVRAHSNREAVDAENEARKRGKRKKRHDHDGGFPQNPEYCDAAYRKCSGK